ncbi:MAG: hypothetical protein ABL958_16920 [Bdellovibrionia bacterium]
MKSIFILLMIVAPSLGFAADINEIANKARQRLYDGGIDEQPLQVQSALYNPKMEAEKVGEGESAPATGATMTVDEAPEN